MFRLSDITKGLLHLNGWQQNPANESFTIAPDLTQSESGFYFQQAHPLLTLTNVRALAPDFGSPTYEVWTTKSYKLGECVSYKGRVYKALADNTNKVPDMSPTVWQDYDPFSDWLRNKTEASIIKVFNRLMTERMLEGTSKTIVDNKMLFDGTGRLVDTVSNTNSLVGFEIVPIRSRGVTIKINKIGLQFTKAGDVKLYIMNSSLAEPYKVITLDRQKEGSFEWFIQPDIYLPYISDTTDAGGSWYLVYKQNELPVDSLAISKSRDWSKGPCTSCSRTEYLSWQAWSKFIEIHPFKVSLNQVTNSLDGNPQLWDIQNNIYTYETNYGLNLEVSVLCDVTDFLIEQRSVFQNVIALQVATDMLREMVFNANVRSNRYALNASNANILYELDGDSTSLKRSGLVNELNLAYKAINLSLNGIDRICMACKKSGIRYRTV